MNKAFPILYGKVYTFCNEMYIPFIMKCIYLLSRNVYTFIDKNL